MGSLAFGTSAVMADTEEPNSQKFFVDQLQECIDRVRARGGTFASSAVVNARARVTSDRIYQAVAQHFRRAGFIVHAPTPLAKWLEAVREAELNDLSVQRGLYSHLSLGNVILVEFGHNLV